MSQNAAAYMSGIVEVMHEKGEVSDTQLERVNKYLEEDGLDHLVIE